MSKICYVPKTFTAAHTRIINTANEILENYRELGISVTLRTLYYRFVARGLIPNDQKEYKRLGEIIGDARLAGRIDWELLEDKTRNLATLEHFDGPQDALDKLASWYHVDMWADQQWRVEAWIEKDAQAGTIHNVCVENDIPYFSCRGYTSLSEMWRASMRLRQHIKDGYTPYIIHFGDHDPSGIDMSRDITERLGRTFMADCQFVRVALNMDQIEEYKPPPNPTKVQDPRAKTYIATYGDDSWELDALEPLKFRELIEDELTKLRDQPKWDAAVVEKQRVKEQIEEVAADWETIGTSKRRLETLERELAKAKADLAKQKKPTKKKRKP